MHGGGGDDVCGEAAKNRASLIDNEPKRKRDLEISPGLFCLIKNFSLKFARFL